MQEYSNFISNYKKGMCDGEDVGALVAKMAHYYMQHNTILVDLQTKVDRVMADTLQTAEGTKPISVSKAEMLVKVSPEYAEAHKMETDKENIEQCINALKSLQRGILREQGYMGNT